MRACPQEGLSRAMAKMSPRRSSGILGLPIRLDFHCQNSLKVFRCHPMNVSGRTAIKAPFQSNSFGIKTIASRVASVVR